MLGGIGGQEEKGKTEDKMAGWHHRLDAHEFGWWTGKPGVCDSWGHRVEHNWATELNWTYTCYLSGFNTIKYFLLVYIKPVQARWASSIWQLHNAQHVVSRSGCQLPQWRERLRATQGEFKFQAWKQLSSQLLWVTWPQSNLMEGGTVSSCAHRSDSRGTSLAAQWLRLHLPIQGSKGWGGGGKCWSLIVELKSHMPHGQKT